MSFVQQSSSTSPPFSGDDSIHLPSADSAPLASHSLSRVHWIDYAKGIAIALVVLGHVNLGIIAAGLVGKGSRPYLSELDDFLYAFHMPVFFFVGGLFAERLRRRPASKSAVTLACTIVYPYFIWAAIQGLIGLCFQSFTNHATTTRDLAMIAVQPPMQFWFLYVYCLIVLTYLLLAKAHIPSAWIAMFFVAIWTLAAWNLRPGWSPLVMMQIYGIYFVAGDVARSYYFSALDEKSPWCQWWLPVALGCYLIVGLLTWLTDLPMQPMCGFLGITGTCCLGALLATKNVARFIRLCGIFSLEIYVMHTLFSAGVRIGLIHVFGIRSMPVHICLGVLAGLAIPLAIAYLGADWIWSGSFAFLHQAAEPRFKLCTKGLLPRA